MKYVLAVILMLMAGCGELGLAILGIEFRLSPGEDRTIAGEDLTVTFVSVTNDSRCPAGVACVWEGNAEVHVRLARAGQPESAVVLNTSAQFPAEARYLEYTIRLAGLDPYPTAGSTIDQAAYTARLVVTKS